MRSDLDRLMRERGMAGMVVFAQDRYTPAMHYATGQRIAHGVYLRTAAGRAHLICDPMERDTGAKVDAELTTFAQHELMRLRQEEGVPPRAFGRLIGEACAKLGMDGPVAFFGDMGAGYAWELIGRAREVHPAMTVDVRHPDLVTAARTTKEPDEVDALRRAGHGTVAALERLTGYLRSLHRDGDGFRDAGGRVTLGHLRGLLREEFMKRGYAEDGPSIVSQGRDAGVPHNHGDDAQPLRAGETIIVDIFPGEIGGGYHSDITRTYCMGRAPEPVRRLYDDVDAAFRAAMAALKVGEPVRRYQDVTCDVFESRGHSTPRKDPATTEGYCHNLGHGVGLSVHEAPLLGGPPNNTALLEAGMVITVEPGLYYPSRGMGARIEDLLWVRPDGTFENLTPAPYDFEIEPAS
jgi:Xaa-Pro aminopeptidase